MVDIVEAMATKVVIKGASRISSSISQTKATKGAEAEEATSSLRINTEISSSSSSSQGG